VLDYGPTGIPKHTPPFWDPSTRNDNEYEMPEEEGLTRVLFATNSFAMHASLIELLLLLPFGFITYISIIMYMDTQIYLYANREASCCCQFPMIGVPFGPVAAFVFCFNFDSNFHFHFHSDPNVYFLSICYIRARISNISSVCMCFYWVNLAHIFATDTSMSPGY